MNGAPFRPSKQRGFTLVTALFLVSVIALLAVVVSRLSVETNLASARDIQAARAYYATRSALEHAIVSIEADPTRSCPASIEGFTISLDTCQVTDVNEAGTDYHVFALQVSAYAGSRNASTLVRRTLRGRVRIDAP